MGYSASNKHPLKKEYFDYLYSLKERTELRSSEKHEILKNKFSQDLIKKMYKAGLLTLEKEKNLQEYQISQKGEALLENYKVDNAIIMAAGFGSRFVPLTYTTPKGLLKVFGEKMVERQIRQLHEAGIKEIIIVVGYLKETFEYLIDKYGVTLVYNPDFKTKNNLSTLYHVRHQLKNSYILSSDNWLRENMYHPYEYESWYSSIKAYQETEEWILSLNKKNKIKKVTIGGKGGWIMNGPVFFSDSFSKKIVPLIEEAYHSKQSNNWYWEDVFKRNLKTLTMYANKQPDNQVYEFESLDDIREFDKSYCTSCNNRYIELIAKIFKKSESSITNLKPLKTGMTNKSFLFSIDKVQYIFRIPGEGSELLINRKQEYEVYKTIAPLKIADDVIYFDVETGIKITRYIENAQNADPRNTNHLKLCMDVAKKLHHSKLKVDHSFDLRERIQFYEKITNEKNGIFYADYQEVRSQIDELLDFLDQIEKETTLTHIDLIPDNLIICKGKSYLIDWEYSGMADPVIDLAMFSIYSYYENSEIENLMKIYFDREATKEERIRVYSYIAISGFLWAIWSCYKQSLGITFGDYGLKMYRYAKEYCKRTKEIIKTHQNSFLEKEEDSSNGEK